MCDHKDVSLSPQFSLEGLESAIAVFSQVSKSVSRSRRHSADEYEEVDLVSARRRTIEFPIDESVGVGVRSRMLHAPN